MAHPDPDSQNKASFSNPLDLLLGYQLRRASAAILADLSNSLSDLDLRPTDASVVLLIEENPDITQSELGRILGMQRANMAPLVAALTERGWIGRTPADGRSHALTLSPVAKEVAKAIRDRIARHEERFLPELTDAERRALIDLLRRVWTK